ncbi:hypothetical protein RPD_3663 [Rhodopseudomonas palustris BisB5]|uniref:Uncharacterized protein n=1 Tax=Rhodopseudomonas palustris (strain BisB5) TaxID=316057 RepID=Q132V3_RHOPS|nr:hypothetical protein RPD_3663 [Rhodopseudomonas palustris BisB5]
MISCEQIKNCERPQTPKARRHRPQTSKPPSPKACGGDARGAVKSLIVTNDFLEAQLDAIQTQVSTDYARGRLPRSRERKDETNPGSRP